MKQYTAAHSCPTCKPNLCIMASSRPADVYEYIIWQEISSNNMEKSSLGPKINCTGTKLLNIGSGAIPGQLMGKGSVLILLRWKGQPYQPCFRTLAKMLCCSILDEVARQNQANRLASTRYSVRFSVQCEVEIS